MEPYKLISEYLHNFLKTFAKLLSAVYRKNYSGAGGGGSQTGSLKMLTQSLS